jgi:hypothetical protein
MTVFSMNQLKVWWIINLEMKAKEVLLTRTLVKESYSKIQDLKLNINLVVFIAAKIQEVLS